MGWKDVSEVPTSGGTSVPTCIQERIARSAEAPAVLLGNFWCPHAALVVVPETVSGVGTLLWEYDKNIRGHPYGF